MWRPWLFLFFLLMKSWIFPAFDIGCTLLLHRNGHKFPKALAAFAMGVAAMGVGEFLAYASIGGARGGVTRETTLWFAVLYWGGHFLLFVGAWWCALYLRGFRKLSDIRKLWPFSE